MSLKIDEIYSAKANMCVCCACSGSKKNKKVKEKIIFKRKR